MVDVTPKAESAREARARAVVRMEEATRQLILSSGIKKGDVLGVARLAGIQATKRTHELIPLCHPLRITGVDVRVTADRVGFVDIDRGPGLRPDGGRDGGPGGGKRRRLDGL
jgi:cyclic pyranopterin phosphate synthase